MPAMAASPGVVMEDVVACLGFTDDDNPLARVADFPKVVEAMAHLAKQKKEQPDAVTAEQKAAAEKLMEVMRGAAETDGGMAAAEAAGQLLAMVAADDAKNPHLLHVDKWITTCCAVLKRSRPGPPASPRSATKPASSKPTGARAPAAAETAASARAPHSSEALVACAASCLADLMNNPRSTIVCSTRASEIFHCLQLALMLPDASNRMVYFQACRGIAEVLHPATWPTNEPGRVPKRVLELLTELLSWQDDDSSAGVTAGSAAQSDLTFEECGGAERSEAVTNQETTADSTSREDVSTSELQGVAAASADAASPAEVAATAVAKDTAEAVGSSEARAEPSPVPDGGAEQEEDANAGEAHSEGKEGEVEGAEGGEGEGGEEDEPPVLQEDLIRMQAARVVQFMAMSGAANLLLSNAPSIVTALHLLRQQSNEAEVVLQADAAIMSLWLCSAGFAASDPEVRPSIAANLLSALGLEELVDNHRDCSLALVTSTMNPSKADREATLALFARVLMQRPDLSGVLVGHVQDSESLAHQSVVYFVLHLLESEAAAAALAVEPGRVEALASALVEAAVREQHAAPIAALARLSRHRTSRPEARIVLGKAALQRLRNVPGGRVQREVEKLMNVLSLPDDDPRLGPAAASTPSPSAPTAVADAEAFSYREDPSLQSMFFRQLVRTKSGKLPSKWKRTKSADDLHQAAALSGSDSAESSSSHIL